MRGLGGDTYHGELNHEVGEEDLLSAFPLLRRCRDLVRLQLPPVEVRDGVDDNPRDATAEVDNLNKTQSVKSKVPSPRSIGDLPHEGGS